MARVKLDIGGLRKFQEKLRKVSETTKEAMICESLHLMAAEYLREAKSKTANRGGKEFEVSEKAYSRINAYEVTDKGYAVAKNRNRGGRTKQLKRIAKSKKGNTYRVLTPSEHMQRSWMALDIRKKGLKQIIPIVNTASYASFVNDGHRQQKGRFVPAIGKRLTKSFVPGKHITDAAEKKVRSKTGKILQRAYNKYVQERFK